MFLPIQPNAYFVVSDISTGAAFVSNANLMGLIRLLETRRVWSS
ncbi:MAG TPA: hypothetical protein V6D14_19070 [Coleofasciculaceae cyanobacterium]